MNGHYDPEADALSIKFSDARIDTTEEVAEGFLIDLDADGNVVAIEMLYVSERVTDPTTVSFEVFKTSNRLRPAV